MRTTVDIDKPVLEEARKLARREGKALGSVLTELLAQALAGRRGKQEAAPFHWIARPLRPRVDLHDRAAVEAVLDAEDAAGS